ncbi:hypothetical protein [Streptomyces sp. NPDC046939]|uniref:hypothetical protein n=1 Tax=Streptomyces sp. NPDC046939 TaxID=3155376 RepID=UPI0033BFDA5A
MAGHSKVEFAALSRLITDLSTCADGMRTAMHELKDIGPKGSGHDGLEEACDHFQDKWGYGIKLIAEATGGVTEKVAKAGKEFQHVEDLVRAKVGAVEVKSPAENGAHR